MEVSSAQFRRACGFCGKMFEAEEDRLLVTVSRRGETPAHFEAHPACLLGTLSPILRQLWESTPGRLSGSENAP